MSTVRRRPKTHRWFELSKRLYGDSSSTLERRDDLFRPERVLSLGDLMRKNGIS
jgi:hypothetical protein